MADLAGRRYKDLPHAFGYRKALVQGCACKPVPWSYEEAARHSQYQEAEAASVNAEKSAATDNSNTPPNRTAMTAMEPSSVEAASESGVDASSGTMDNAAETSQQTVENYEPMRVKPQKAVVRRRKPRELRAISRRVVYRPTSQPAQDWGIFGKSVSQQ